MSMPFFLEKVISNPASHARWLNSLSYLEYRGFRKIARALQTQDISMHILSHAMEEARHAFYFKKLAVKVGGPAFDSYQDVVLLSPVAVKRYFYDLDQNVMSLFQAKFGSLQYSQIQTVQSTIYQVVTWLIEERAMEVYRTYDQLLKNKKFEFSLGPVIADESRHLSEVGESAKKLLSQMSLDFNQILKIENQCFEHLWQSLQSDLDTVLEMPQATVDR
ncbi:MAG: hypothetical protein ACOYOK_07450 [Pseudobdellovibrionaceae bacterium]